MCPVTGGVALATTMLGAGAMTTAAGVAVATVGAAAIGAGIGVAVGGAVNLATGRGFFEGAGKSAIFGAVGGGLGGALSGAAPFVSSAGTFANLTSAGAYFGSATNIAVGAAAGSFMNLMTPQTPDYSQFGYGAQPYEAFGYSSQHAKVTGSGGRQAAAVLASEIKQAKSLRQRQAGAEDYGLGMDMAGTGLQIA